MKLTKTGLVWYWRVVAQLNSGLTAISWCKLNAIHAKSLGRWKHTFYQGGMAIPTGLSPDDIQDQLNRALIDEVQESNPYKAKRYYRNDESICTPYHLQETSFVEVKIKAVADV